MNARSCYDEFRETLVRATIRRYRETGHWCCSDLEVVERFLFYIQLQFYGMGYLLVWRQLLVLKQPYRNGWAADSHRDIYYGVSFIEWRNLTPLTSVIWNVNFECVLCSHTIMHITFNTHTTPHFINMLSLQRDHNGKTGKPMGFFVSFFWPDTLTFVRMYVLYVSIKNFNQTTHSSMCARTGWLI